MSKLNEKQVELLAKYLTASNTGLLMNYEIPKTPQDINYIYEDVSGNYETELGEGLGQELKSWKKDINAGKFHDQIGRIPFIMEVR